MAELRADDLCSGLSILHAKAEMTQPHDACGCVMERLALSQPSSMGKIGGKRGLRASRKIMRGPKTKFKFYTTEDTGFKVTGYGHVTYILATVVGGMFYYVSATGKYPV